jgi:hypothetical protein
MRYEKMSTKDRNKLLVVRVTEEEMNLLKDGAVLDDRPVSNYVRATMLEVARTAVSKQKRGAGREREWLQS